MPSASACRSSFDKNARPGEIAKMAECRELAPLARRHALVSTEARLACPVDIPKWCPWQDLHLHCRRFGRWPCANTLCFGLHGQQDGAPGQICTDTARGLSPKSE